MKIPHRLRSVKFRSASGHLTSFSGLPLLINLAIRLGLVRDLQGLTVKKRRRGIPIEDFVLSLAGNFLIGGDSLTDLDVLRQEEVTRKLCYDLQVPAPTTAGERLRSFGLGHLDQMATINGNLVLEVDERIGGDDPATIDLDSSIFETHGCLREGARYGYSKVRGLHPLLAFWHERRLLLGCRLRSGNRASADGVESFIAEILTVVPARLDVRLRMDAGFYASKVEAVCLEHSLGFSISAKLTERLRSEIESLPEELWQPYPWEQDTQWAELAYQPNGWSRAYRLLVKRTAWYEKDQRVLGEYFVTSVITSLRGAGQSLIRYHLARGGMENYIEEFKNGIGAAHLPSQRFLANWAWLSIAMLAYNLAQAFKLLLLPAAEHHHQIKKLRFHWINVAGQWIRTGRRWIVALARGPTTVAAFVQVQKLLLAI